MLRSMRPNASGRNGWTLLGVLVGIAIVALITIALTAVLRSGSNKITRRTIDKLVCEECAQVTRPVGNGAFDLTVGQITEFGLADVLGPSLTVKNVKVKWEKRRKGCFYTLVMTGTTEDGEKGTKESEERAVPCD